MANTRSLREAMIYVILYLEGKIDIYNPVHDLSWVVHWWDFVWDEGRYLGCDMETVSGVNKYMCEVGL